MGDEIAPEAVAMDEGKKGRVKLGRRKRNRAAL